MRRQRRIWLELLGMGLVAGIVAFVIAYSTRHHGEEGRTAALGFGSPLDTRNASFTVQPGGGRLSARSRDGAVTRDLELTLVVDGILRPIAVGQDEVKADKTGLHAKLALPIGDQTVDATLTFRLDAANDALLVDLHVTGDRVVDPHSIALHMELSSNGQLLFVPGIGEIADHALVSGGALVVDSEPHPVSVISTRGPLEVSTIIDDPQDPTDQLRAGVTSPPITLSLDAGVASADTDLRLVVAESSQRLWGNMFALTGTATQHVKGTITGTKDRARFFGRDGQGVPAVRGLAGEDGQFEVDVPVSVIEWYAAIDASRASALASFVPGTAKDLVLDVSPGGELKVSIVDFDTKRPITARLLVRGVDGTVDPSFGPDYRASGAGPLIDALRGDIQTPLPSGKYRVMATKGIEWSVDEATVEIGPGRTAEVHLAPRHVVPTPGLIGCDLHVHSRPSFDSPVSVEDRVLSLVSAGVDFAVPTEHNVVGDYSSAIETFGLGKEFSSVTGVEVTTMGGGFGHFGVFPYPKTDPPPPARRTSWNAMVKAIRANDPKRYFQVNHPRLPKGIGYFNMIGFSPKIARSSLRGRFDFDGIEVFNGFDIEKVERVEQVMKDWHALLNFGYRHVATGSSDAHRIQYQWAGYPRTMAILGGPGTDTIDEKFDPLAVVAAIKKGHSTITSGPILEFELGGVRPGDEINGGDDPIKGHVRVHAAPWIDVTQVQVIVNGRVIQTFPVESRPTKTGREDGSIEEAQARTLRFDQDITVPIGPDNGWAQIIVRGDRRMSDVLPFMKVAPFAFSNPVWVTRRYVPPPPLILTGPVGDGGRPPAPPLPPAPLPPPPIAPPH